MLTYKILPSSIYGRATVPPSKSQTLRAILWAAVSQGLSTIENILYSPDSLAMINACKQLGAQITLHSTSLAILGSPQLVFPENTIIHAGNSGILFRFFTALAAAYSKNITITGFPQLQRRPIAPLLQSLINFGATFSYHKDEGSLPFTISGPLSSGHTVISGEDSQYASALAIACSLADGLFSFTVSNPKELPWLRLTLWWLDQLHIPYVQSENTYSFPKKSRPQAFSYKVSGDFSSAAFLVAGALLSQSPYPTYLYNLNIQEMQGDKHLLFLLKKLGANIIFENNHVIVYPSTFSGGHIDMDPFIDALPILAVLCCFATSPSYLYNAQSAKNKESNRILAIAQELQKMGAWIQPCDDGLVINPSPLHGATLYSHEDHRIAMALSIAALYATGESTIYATDCVNKTFPNFVSTLTTLHAHIQENNEYLPMRPTHSW
ncbi:3-phosphoshikimate 1-carboxyvinyltransferase [Bacteroides fragilis str. S6L5]|uniref:3-phosphoshikimate 1-carboxyvinyltransferase n=1 Tax=Chlamydia gallinacea TaxID=1457153 RepID=UPI0004499B3A|nr:3-phosphoshikimate 1-carboxyvinyltransferase [Chlamydia gallinacea]EYE60880.1 3-phosphoshikimate 1-carboxyvinyltransferase [Bacteroides fragilis str. S6L5]